MAFEAVIGQERVKEILIRAAQRERLPHALLFHGPEGVGKDALAIELAKAINCTNPPCGGCPSCRKIDKGQHPDVHLIFPIPSNIKPEEHATHLQEKTRHPYAAVSFTKASSISIKAIRGLQRSMSYKPFEAKYKVAIIAEADKMTIEAANAFLKSLEEPPPDTVLILTTSKPHALLSTILSRCQKLRFDPLNETEIEGALLEHSPDEPHRARLASRLAIGNYRRAQEFIKDDIDRRRTEALSLLTSGLSGTVAQIVEASESYMGRVNTDELKTFLNLSLLWMRDLLLLHEKRDEQHIANIDRLEELKDWTSTYTESDVRRWIEATKKTLELIDRNVNVQLAIIGLMQSFRNST